MNFALKNLKTLSHNPGKFPKSTTEVSLNTKKTCRGLFKEFGRSISECSTPNPEFPRRAKLFCSSPPGLEFWKHLPKPCGQGFSVEGANERQLRLSGPGATPGVIRQVLKPYLDICKSYLSRLILHHFGTSCCKICSRCDYR